jgi:hypothetical protein
MWLSQPPGRDVPPPTASAQQASLVRQQAEARQWRPRPQMRLEQKQQLQQMPT